MRPASGAGRWIQGALWLVALGIVVVLWLFPDAVSRLRTAGALYAETDRACDLSSGPCAARFDDGVVVALAATPQPAGPTDPIAITVTVDGDPIPVAVELQGVEMAMGFLRQPLVEGDDGWTATAHLPVCTTERMLWKADVILDDRVAGFFLWATRS